MIKLQAKGLCVPWLNPKFPGEQRRSLAAAAAIHLQWFADDNEADGRTEEPTEHKLQRLREEGQVVKSQELTGALTLLLPALMLLFLAPSMLRTCVDMVRFFFLRATELDPTRDGIVAAAFFNYLARLALPILAVAVFSAIFSNIVQIGFVFTTKPLVPDLTKILPKVGQFFRRALFSVDGLFNFFKSIIKMAIIGLVAFFLIRADINKLLNLQKVSLWLGLSTVASLAIRMFIISALLMLIVSIPDYMFQRWRFRERNKMSRQELKEEMRMYEADPQIQSRIRSRFRDLLRQNIAVTVPKADVVITNPTRLAVALEYRNGMRGPMVSAMGADEMAARIREIAGESGVPLVEDKPLAWALYRETSVGDIIPEAYFTAVAAVLSKVYAVNELRRARSMSA
ncbi:MAG: EscU/YscU/HrcU family type III secretion system export apparatus switch protein [Treponema sp.]|nr:EscU/YscU/HrcU family type III secretion system export apparatus switch protein [Treponema sp.]